MFKKSLITVIALLVICLVLLFTLDLGFLKNTIERQVRDATGRSFEIDGDLSINLGSELLIRSTDLKLGNASWAGENQLAEIRELSVRIDARSIWKGPLVIHQLDLDGVNLFLAQDENGQSNWVLDETADADTDQQLPFLIESLSLKNTEIHFRSPRLDQPIHGVIESLEQRIEANDMIHADLLGRLSDRTVSFSGTAGPNSRFLSGSDFAVKGSGNLGSITVAGSAVFDNLWAPDRPEFNLEVAGPELSELTEMFGIEGLGAGNLSFTADGSSDGEHLTTRLLGNFGEFNLDITSVQGSMQEINGSSLDAKVSGPNFGRIARLLDLEGWPEGKFDVKARIHRPENGLQIDDFQLSLAGASVTLSGTVPDFPRAGGSRLSLDVSGNNLAPFQGITGLPSLPAGLFSLKGDVSAGSDGSTRIDVRYSMPLASGTLSGMVGDGEGLVGSDLKLSGAGQDANALGKVLDISGLSPNPWNVSAGIRINHPEHVDLADARFRTSGLSVELAGRVGTVSLQKHTDVQFVFAGDRLSDFQALMGDQATLPAQPFRLAGRASAIAGAWKLEGITGNAGRTGFRMNGTLGQGASLAGTDLVIEAEGTDLEKMFSLPGEARLPDGPFTVNSRVSLSGDRLGLSGVHAQAGAFSFKLDADLPWPMDVSRGNFKLETGGKNIARILPELAGLELDAEEYDIRANGNWRDGQISVGDARIRIGKSTMTAKGTLDLPPDLSATDMAITINSPDLSRLGTIDGNRWGTVPFDLNTSFKGTRSQFTMDQFQARLGESQILGTLSVDFQPGKPEFNLRLTTKLVNLKPFQVESPVEETAAQPGPGAESRMIPEQVFPMEELARVNGTFAFTADKVLMKRMTLQNNVVNGEVRDGGITINEMGTDGYRGRVTASASLLPTAAGPSKVKAKVKSENLIINLTQQSEDDKKALPPFNINIDLAGSGKSTREAAASLNGSIEINSPGGLVKNKPAESASGLFLAEIVAAISPSESRKDVINISCFAADIQVSNGVVRLDPGIALQSDKLNVFATGNANLASEKLDISFRTQTRNAVNLSASELVSPFVKLSGTMSDPSISLDAKGTLLSGGAAYLSGGLSILAKKALGSLTSAKNPCDKFLDEPVPE